MHTKLSTGLYAKIMLIVGSVFAVTLIAILVLVYATESRGIEQNGLTRAQSLNQMAFEALYTSMRMGGGSGGNQQVITRLQEQDAFNSLRVIKGEPVIEQFGGNASESSFSELERRALAGETVQEVRWENGHPLVSYAAPIRVEAECQACHQAQIGAINGVISTEISLQGVGDTLRLRRDLLLRVVGGGLLILILLMIYTVRQLVISPLQTIQRGVAAIAEGDLEHRLDVQTGDELEDLATEINQMAQQLGESYGRIAEEQSKVMAALEASSDAIWISNADREITTVNSALERLVGKQRKDLLGHGCQYLMGMQTFDGASVCDTSCPFLNPNDKTGSVEGCMPTVRGENAWVEIGYGRVTDADGNLAQVVHIVHDLTERKEVERLKDEFVSMVSHELRTPLHHIKGFATTLLQTDVEWDAETQHDFLVSINHEADRLATLVEKILHLSRLDAGQLPMDRDWYTIEDLVDRALTRRRSLTTGRQTDLDLQPDLPPLFVDGREIEIVLINLLDNAQRYSYPDAPITLGVELLNSQMVFCVTDQGQGIAKEHLDSIFDQFYRIDEQKHDGVGIGLGLAICKRIVETHGGRIWVESTPGIGSSFLFSLPAHSRRPGGI